MKLEYTEETLLEKKGNLECELKMTENALAIRACVNTHTYLAQKKKKIEAELKQLNEELDIIVNGDSI